MASPTYDARCVLFKKHTRGESNETIASPIYRRISRTLIVQHWSDATSKQAIRPSRC